MRSTIIGSKFYFVLKGYTLLEFVVVMGIFLIMGVVLMNGAPNMNKYVGFSKDTLLLTDTLRDIQVKGVSSYSAVFSTSAFDQDKIIGYGLYIDISDINKNNILTTFADLEDESLGADQYGIKSSNKEYDELEKLEDQRFDYSHITNMYSLVNDSVDGDTQYSKSSVQQINIVFVRPNITPIIKYLDINESLPVWKEADKILVELYYASLLGDQAFRCIAIEQSGQTVVSGGKCN